MTNEQLGYDKTSAESIWQYSAGLIGHTLRDFVSNDYPANFDKGKLGKLVEEIYFHVANNSRAEADFDEAGLELKCSPLKRDKKNALRVKERLVCNMINYCNDVNVSFEESHFYLKCQLMLILYYLHLSDTSKLDLEFLYSILWRLPEKDLLIIRRDYETIIDKIRKGRAHEISEGDTMYLGACRKGEKGSDTTAQPYSDIKAPTRAFCLKMAYMRTILEYAFVSGSSVVCNYEIDLPQLVTKDDLKAKSFEDIIMSRFQPYIGKNAEDIVFPNLNTRGGTSAVGKFKPKQNYAMLTSAIASNGKTTRINQTDEFQKAGLTLKTFRVKHNGRLPEAIAFENINYQEVLECNDWYDSRLYDIFTSRFMFAIFREQTENGDDYALEKVFFWTMPVDDLGTAEEYWNNIKQCVTDNQIDSQHFWRMGDHKKFHVRPKARNSKDLAENPNGGKCKKFCYWWNQEYMKQIIEEN